MQSIFFDSDDSGSISQGISPMYYCRYCCRRLQITYLCAGGTREDCIKCDWDNLPEMVKEQLKIQRLNYEISRKISKLES